MHEKYSISPIGITDWRSVKIPFGIKQPDRLFHIYAIGKTGVGKSTLLERIAISDINAGRGLCVIDPHGDVAETLLNHIPEHRIKDVIYLCPSDTEFPMAFNPLIGISHDYHHLVASGLVGTFKKIWSESWGPRLEYILRFTLLTLLSYPHASLLQIQPLLTDIAFRKHVLSFVTNPFILSFWNNEFDKYAPTFRQEAISPILNKTGLFLTNAPLRNCVGQHKRTFRIQQIMDQGKIIIANLSKGELGEEVSSLIGSMLVTSIQQAALHRSKQKADNRKPFFLFVDEMHSFISLSFMDILAEARKYGLGLFLTHQYIDQLNEKIRDAIFGNVGTIISFRIGANDAEYLKKEFFPIFSESDLVNLPKHSMYLKLMIDGTTSKPFSAMTEPIEIHTKSFKQEIISISRNTHCTPRELVETELISEMRVNDPDRKDQQLTLTL